MEAMSTVAPSHPMNPQAPYAGFWLRLAASLIDTLWLGLLIYALVALLIGPEALRPGVPYTPLRVVLEWVLPISIVIAFWVFRSATPGKMLFKLKVVDADTLGPVPVPRLLLRYAGYYIASLPLGLGLMWVGWDARKQGWHDKIAGTVVIRQGGTFPTAPARAPSEPAQDDNAWPS